MRARRYIHAPVRTRHCTIHFQQSVRFVAVYLRDQRPGQSARHYRVNDSRSSRCRRIYPATIGTRLIDGDWYVCDYVVFFLLDTRCRQMERIHRPDSVEPHRGILVQRCRPSLCLYRVVFDVTSKESCPTSVGLISRTRRVGGKCRKPSAQLECTNEQPDIDRGCQDAPRQRAVALWVISVGSAMSEVSLLSRSLLT
jgi:hypothetical protein